ncbi:hypothetical protein [Marinomonas shanghaiensis]|jgi:hypothetical protein|uniref:hypothetical protein n=1 Tax=Marinomonas shanghaiensis TaxID=2202418 RepID=UPI0013004358|nr:hypothetical protein [Marinomonas shanghaiensis]
MSRLVWVLICLFVSVSSMLKAESNNEAKLKMLDQLEKLEQLDQMDFEDAIDNIYQCSQRNDFFCADQQINRAKSLLFDEIAKQRLADAVGYRKQQEIFYGEEKKLAEQRQLVSECSNSCAIPGEYERCVAGTLRPLYCNEPRREEPVYTQSESPSTMQLLGSALQHFNTQLQTDMTRQQAELQQQLKLAEQQRLYRDEQQKKQQQQQRELQQKQQQALAQLQQQEERLRRQADIKRQEEVARKQREEEQRLAQQKRTQEIQAQRLLKEREQAEKVRQEMVYLNSLASGTRLGGKDCFGENHVLGSLPNIQPKMVSCVDVKFTIQCPSSPVVEHQGVMKNMIGTIAGCFGDTTRVPDTISCPADKFIVQVTSAERCTF